ncbi:alanine--glyoxylate aminotransferase family protein [bacterium]|nr:alanine--glyoxylate aminotransferase family protein [bacterium]
MKSNAKEKILFTPGPLNIPLRVREAMLQEMGSRTKDFTRVIRDVEERIASLVPSTSHEVILSSGSATEMLEKVISNFIEPSQKILVIENGFYGRRLVKLSEGLGFQPSVISGDPFKPLRGEKIVTSISNESFDWVVMVHCETSSGILNPISEILRAVCRRDCRVLLDCVSSFPASEIPWDLVTVGVTTSGKCLQGPPGLPIAVVQRGLLEQAGGNPVALTRDLFLHWQNVRTNGQWRYTPPIPLILGLHEALKVLEEKGGPKQMSRTLKELTGEAVRLLAPLGLELLNDPHHSMAGILTFKVPDCVEWQKVVEDLDRQGLVVYPGILDSVPSFRICVFGDLESRDLSILSLKMAEAFDKFAKPPSVT